MKLATFLLMAGLTLALKQQFPRQNFDQACGNPEAPECKEFIFSLAKEVTQAAYGEIYLDLREFLSGMGYGLQANPAVQSDCQRSLSTNGKKLNELTNAASNLVSNLNVDTPFEFVYSIDNLVNALVSSYMTCGFQTLYDTINGLNTRIGFRYLISNFAVNFDVVIDNLEKFLVDLQTGNISGAGVFFGTSMRYLLDFSI